MSEITHYSPTPPLTRPDWAENGQAVAWNDPAGWPHRGELRAIDDTGVVVNEAANGIVAQTRRRWEELCDLRQLAEAELLAEGVVEAPATKTGRKKPAGPAATPAAQKHPTWDIPGIGRHVVVSVAKVRPNPKNPRKHFDPEALAELAKSLKEDGLIQPLTVRPTPEGDQYELVAGERRWRAAQLAGLTEVPAIIRTDLDDVKAARMMLVENLKRSDLNPIEAAEGMRALEELGLKQREIGEQCGLKQNTVSATLMLLRLPAGVQDRIRKGDLSRSHGEELARFGDFPEIASAIGELAVLQKVTVKELAEKLPFANILRSKGLAREIRNQAFSLEVCKKCPFGAYRNAHGWHWCLNPDHYDELQKAGVVAQETRRKEERAQAEARAQAEGIPLAVVLGEAPLREGEWCHLGRTPPAGCTEACPCRSSVPARHGPGEVAICTDKPRHFRLIDEERIRQAAERTRRAAALRAAGAAYLEAVELPDLGEGERRLVAWIVSNALTGVSHFGGGSELLAWAVKSRGLALDPNALLRWDRTGDSRAALASLPARTQLTLLAEVLIRQEVTQIEQGCGRAQGAAELLQWLTGCEPEAPDPAKEETPQTCPACGETITAGRPLVAVGVKEGGRGCRMVCTVCAPAHAECWKCGSREPLSPVGSYWICGPCVALAGEAAEEAAEEGPECASCGTDAAGAWGGALRFQEDGTYYCAHCDPEVESCARCGDPLPEGRPAVEGAQPGPGGIRTDDQGYVLTSREASYCPACAADLAVCRVCGCTQEAGCEVGCYWVEDDLCSACAGREERVTVTCEKGGGS
jgi:ParB/RepB/Spo0J family partition protein